MDRRAEDDKKPSDTVAHSARPAGESSGTGDGAETRRTLLPRLRKHPSMYIPGLSFMTACAFIDGYALGTGEPLSEFHRWLVQRGTTRPELGWPWLVLGEIYPADSLPDPRSLPATDDADAAGALFQLLDEYLASRPPTVG